MKLEITRVDVGGELALATMTHKGEQLQWQLSFIDKLERHTARQRQERQLEEFPTFDIFEQINSYWSHQDPSVQDKIFDVYRRIRDVLYQIWDTHELTKTLYPLVAELYQYHQMETIKDWYVFHSGLTLHPKWDLKDVYTSDSAGTRDKTYLKSEYKELTMLTVAIRAMIPVWGEFITKTAREKGTAFKEYYAFKLLSYASLMHSVAMERLRLYVEVSIPQDKTQESAILRAISSDDYPIWLLSKVVVRRLAVADMRPLDPDSNLVTFIYRYIGQMVKGQDNTFMGLIKPKQIEGQSQEGENNLSKLEGYKIKEAIPAGDIAMLAFDITNHRKVIDRVCPDLDAQLLQQSLTSVQALADKDIQRPQLSVMQWVLSPVLNPRGAEHLNKVSIMENLAITQAMLWHRGHFDIAALLTAIPLSNEQMMNVQGNESRTKMKGEVFEELNRLFPYTRKPPKQKIQRDANAGVNNINLIATEFSRADWRLTVPADWVAKLTGNKNNRLFTTPFDIKIKLAALAIAVADGKF